ncbi:hypothetical protein B0T24DRAFT_538399 [Lasiosphaeria ovina]|uniref:Uncharacterized protein n=1 Tax=Lasiosphaeria ovina TaxID=92902 RepID=A0AAE0JUH8_9PEZI|nr:hypothetical protein B0T24DRAFT_538399 [Lasiosphaeria ovina]
MFASIITLAGFLAAATALPASGFFRANSTAAGAAGAASANWACSGSSTYTEGDSDQGKGVWIKNSDSQRRGFYAYHNSCDAVPFKHIWINGGDTRFISFPDRWEGRITRGDDGSNLNGQPQLLATWLEFSLDQNGWIWGDVSLIRGTDGAVRMWTSDGSNQERGFSQNVIDSAPGNVIAYKPNGARVIMNTEGPGGAITPARDYLLNVVGAGNAYIDDAHGNPVITSTNGRFSTEWYAGHP